MRTGKKVLLVAVALLLAGVCAFGQSKRLLVSRWAGPHADFQKQVVKEYPSATVTIDDIDYASLKAKQLTAFQAVAGKGSYDVVWVNSQWMKEYVDAGYLVPLDDLIKKNKLDTSIYSKGLLEGTQFYGKTWGFPTYAQCLILAYDSAAFEKAKLQPPKTADELVAVAKYFKEKEGSGIAIPARQGTAAVTLYSQLMFSSGGYYLDKNGVLDLSAEPSVYAATIYDQLVKYAVPGVTAWHHDETALALRTKVAPIATIMSGLAGQNHDPEKSRIVDTVRYAPITGKTGIAAANNSFWVWAIAKNSSDVDESFKFISWFTSPAIEKKQTLANQQISAINSLSSDPEVLKVMPWLPVVMSEFANGRTDPASANLQKLKDALVAGLSAVATTDEEPGAMLKRVQDQLKGIDFTK
jgi:ABC-type glycerol-3-phosphate transport system substrate-binding protein